MLRTRPVISNDIDFLWSMLFYAAHADEQPEASVASIRLNPDLGRYLCDWGREGDLAFVATTDQEVRVGAAWVRLFTSSEKDLATYVAPEIPELAIAVKPDRTGQGVGSLLLDRLLAEADDVGTPAIVLSARSDNPAIQLYRRFGFVETDQIVNRVGTSSTKMVRQRPR